MVRIFRIALVCGLTLFLTSPIVWSQEKAAPEAPNAADDDATKVVVKPQKSYLSWMVESSGPIGGVLFLMSMATVALSIQGILMLRRSVLVPPDLVSQFDQLLSEKQYQQAYDVANEDTSFLGKVLAAGMRRISGGHAEALEAMEQVGEDENMRIEHRLSWLAILGTLGPLLGLLGTVEGIIASFRVIATSDTQPKPSLLAEGISTSLFNTFEGLFVAIIATVAFMLLRNQAARLVLEAEIASENLMFRFKNVQPTKAA